MDSAAEHLGQIINWDSETCSVFNCTFTNIFAVSVPFTSILQMLFMEANYGTMTLVSLSMTKKASTLFALKPHYNKDSNHSPSATATEYSLSAAVDCCLQGSLQLTTKLYYHTKLVLIHLSDFYGWMTSYLLYIFYVTTSVRRDYRSAASTWRVESFCHMPKQECVLIK